MDTKLLARIGAVIFVAVAITMTAIELSRDPEAGRDETRVARPAAASADPLMAELQRCQMLGQAGATDPNCLRAWGENRRRFLSSGARPAARIADGAAPATNGASPKEN
ncbi:putative entry exclusion protein TrbK-alt [Sphingomonas albertensis]|uniref:Entry exclusion protein TrbK-alt n=1 Tax=Sphingomonas albertensis TaxID=2762591 RepID=A0ABR7ALE2_9SPHN|nr:putative entry exclusion protein TrbK-alt [Sphingomonas albertensis]MBC3941117.1 putative entry exclusion protein TrbK-alt [Sphingomonas albertensis]